MAGPERIQPADGGGDLAQTLRKIAVAAEKRQPTPRRFWLTDARMWAAVIALALVFLFTLNFYMYLAIIRPIAQHDALIDLKENMELQALTLQNDLIDLQREHGSAQSQLDALRTETAGLEQAIQTREDELRAVDAALADRPTPPPAPPPKPAPDQAKRVAELEAIIQTRDRQLATLRQEKQRQERNLAERIVQLEQDLQNKPSTESIVIADRRRFVIDELMAKAGLVAKRNAVQLAFAKALMEAGQLYDSDILPIPRAVLREQFLIKYPQLRAIPVLRNGRAIIEAQMRNAELDLLEASDQDTLVNLINRYLEFNATAMEAPLILQVDPNMTQGQFDQELDRLDRAYVEFFLDLENMRRFLLSAQ